MYCSCHACCHVMACCHAFMSCIVHSCMLTCVSAVLSCIVHVHVMCCVHISRMFLSCCIIVMCDLLARKAGLFAIYSLLTFVRDVMCHNIMHALVCHSIMHVVMCHNILRQPCIFTHDVATLPRSVSVSNRTRCLWRWRRLRPRVELLY